MIDVIGLGSALIDITIEVDEDQLKELQLEKGNMHLIDEARSGEILGMLSSRPMVKTPGGSAANTVAGVATLGGKGLFIGKVGCDAMGDYYREESERMGVIVRLGRHDGLTGHAITLITPDSERTFATHLGAALLLRESDIVKDDVASGKILHVEGYLLENPELKKASIYAMNVAKRSGVKVSIDLADPALIRRNTDLFKDLMRDYADIIFVNEDEAAAFTGREGVEALHELSKSCEIAIVKLGSKGSIVKAAGRVYEVPSYAPDVVVNTNGAGDMYAAGFLYGLSQNYSIERSGKIGSFAASLVVSQVGARLIRRLDPGQIGI